MFKLINKQRNKKGFTLIELIVVIAILGILALIAIPRFTGMREGANQSAVIANLTNIQKAGEMVAIEKNKAIGDVTDLEVEAVLGVTFASMNNNPAGATYDFETNGEATVTGITAPMPGAITTLKYSTIP
jgi:type IV pilus assembly protein PilA